MIDYLVRKQGLTYSEAANVLAAPFWSTIEHMPEDEKRRMLLLRQRFPSMLINGPFSILVGFTGGMMALNDRLKLRSMVVAETEDMAYVASEECAIRRIAPDVTNVWAPRAVSLSSLPRKGVAPDGCGFFYPAYEVVRNQDRCITCRVCERQCANKVHLHDAELGADDFRRKRVRQLPALRVALPDPRAENRQDRQHIQG